MGESGMSKYVINTVEVVKRIYLADAYTEEEALKKQKVQSLNNGAEKVVELGELLYSIETINSYEYQKDWVDLASGRNKRHKSEWVHAQEDGRADELGTPAVEPAKDYYDQ